MTNGEQNLLESWSIKLALLTAITLPTITATGAYFKLDSKIQEKEALVTQRVTTLELDSSRSFADKADLKEMQLDIKQMREDIVEIKTMLKRSR